MAKKIKGYPKKEGDRLLYVRYPVQVTKDLQPKFLTRIKIGKWVAADVVEDGFQPLPNAASYDKFDDCLKACDSTNKLHGFSKDRANEIISLSMGQPA